MPDLPIGGVLTTFSGKEKGNIEEKGATK